ncbi:MAG: EI24 domain-containing protein [Bacteroidota bacterium]
MNIFKEILIGIQSFWQAFLFIKKHKLYWYGIIPAILMLGIYKLGYEIKDHIFTTDLHTINDIVWYIIQLFFEISLAMLLMNFSKYLVVALLSPLLAFLSQKTEQIVTGNRYVFNRQQFILDVKRAIIIVSRNFMWYYFFFLIVVIISFIGWKNPKDSPVFYITYFIGFYYYGFSFIDYINERRKLSVNESIIFIRKHRGLALGIGAIYSLLIFVPVNLNALFTWHNFYESPLEVVANFITHLFLWICASFAPILACVASTLAMNKIVGLKK